MDPNDNNQPNGHPFYFNPYFPYFSISSLPQLPNFPFPLSSMGPTNGSQPNERQTLSIKQEEPKGGNSLGTGVIEKNSTLYSCHCVKSHCLKEYCLCFKNGLACQQKCSCSGCKNLQDDLNEKLKPKANQKIKCRCNKSQCIKKYCECYSAKKKCEETCLCIGCQN